MQIMGTNTWERDIPRDKLIEEALKFADRVREQGIAELLEASIAEDEKLMWCTWNTDDFDALQGAFEEMNRQFGLSSTLTPITTMFHAPVG